MYRRHLRLGERGYDIGRRQCMFHERVIVQVIHRATTLERVSAKPEALPILEVFGDEKQFSHINASLVSLMLRIKMGSVNQRHGDENGNENGPLALRWHSVLRFIFRFCCLGRVYRISRPTPYQSDGADAAS